MFAQISSYFDQSFHDMFVLTVPVLEKMLRPLVVYVFLIIGLRLAGKRNLTQLNPFDLVVLLTLSNTVQNAIIGEDNTVTGGILGASTLLFVNYLVVRFLYNHEKLEHLCEGDPDVLIDKGRVLGDRLKAELITRTQLEVAAHKQGISSLDDVERATLEPGGGISFVAHKPEPEVMRHYELMARLESIGKELAKLRGQAGTQSA